MNEKKRMSLGGLSYLAGLFFHYMCNLLTFNVIKLFPSKIKIGQHFYSSGSQTHMSYGRSYEKVEGTQHYILCCFSCFPTPKNNPEGLCGKPVNCDLQPCVLAAIILWG